MESKLIEFKGVGKNLSSEAVFLEIECSSRFVNEVKTRYGLSVSYNSDNLTIKYSESHSETCKVKDIENDNLVVFLMRQKQGEDWFYMTCPFWYIQQNYNINYNELWD